MMCFCFSTKIISGGKKRNAAYDPTLSTFPESQGSRKYLSVSAPGIVAAFNIFIKAAAAPGAVAVHCAAGLGRTGTQMALYMMMRHHGFAAREAMGWLRIMRPGSVIGEQQHFLCEREETWSKGSIQGRDASAAAALASQVAAGMEQRGSTQNLFAPAWGATAAAAVAAAVCGCCCGGVRGGRRDGSDDCIVIGGSCCGLSAEAVAVTDSAVAAAAVSAPAVVTATAANGEEEKEAGKAEAVAGAAAPADSKKATSIPTAA